MIAIALHIDLPSDHPARRWASAQADSVQAHGHVGTHLDCYTRQPPAGDSTLSVHVFDCRQGMPGAEDFRPEDVHGRAVVFFTGALARHGYGTPAYAAAPTFLRQADLDALLACGPAFVLIDSSGIGEGSQHKAFDRQCEAAGCFVVENIRLDAGICRTMRAIRLVIAPEGGTGRPCEVYALCHEDAPEARENGNPA